MLNPDKKDTDAVLLNGDLIEALRFAELSYLRGKIKNPEGSGPQKSSLSLCLNATLNRKVMLGAILTLCMTGALYGIYTPFYQDAKAAVDPLKKTMENTFAILAAICSTYDGVNPEEWMKTAPLSRYSYEEDCCNDNTTCAEGDAIYTQWYHERIRYIQANSKVDFMVIGFIFLALAGILAGLVTGYALKKGLECTLNALPEPSAPKLKPGNLDLLQAHLKAIFEELGNSARFYPRQALDSIRNAQAALIDSPLELDESHKKAIMQCAGYSTNSVLRLCSTLFDGCNPKVAPTGNTKFETQRLLDNVRSMRYA